MLSSTTFQPRAAPAIAPPRPEAAAPAAPVMPAGACRQPARTAIPAIPANAIPASAAITAGRRISPRPRGVCGGRGDWGLRRKTGLEARIVAEAAARHRELTHCPRTAVAGAPNVGLGGGASA